MDNQPTVPKRAGHRRGEPTELTPTQIERYLAIARRAADKASSDPQVVEEAANEAVHKLLVHWNRISAEPRQRDGWVATVARNHAKRVGARLHRDLPMGRAGSLPPLIGDEHADQRVEFLIAEMHRGGASLGSFVAAHVDFAERWQLLSRDTRALLHAKYVDGMTAKDIAEERKRGESPGVIDNKLLKARRAAQLVFEDLYDDDDAA